jgi:anti-anti-sigma factor
VTARSRLLSNQRVPGPLARNTVVPVITGSSNGKSHGDAPFGCAVHRRGTTSAIELEGELDLATCATLDEAMEAAMDSGTIDTVVVDLTRVTFADSTTLGWLVRSEARMQEAGGRLVAMAGPGPVLDLLRLTGLDRRLTLVDDASML